MKQVNEDTEIIWSPIPGSSQELALDTRCNHTLYDGTRGPGKTITQLMRYRRRVGLGYGSFWRGIIFDKEFKNLSDLVAQSKRFFKAFGDGAKFHESASDYKWVWPTGEELLLRHVKKLSDYESFHGHEYPFIGWNELTKHATPDLYDKLMSTNRSSFVPEMHTPKVKNDFGKVVYDTPDGKPLQPIPLEVFSTTNPSGPGHNWVKQRFITIAPRGTVVKSTVRVFDPRTQKDVDVTRTQVAIFGSYRENIYLTAEYIAELDRLTETNENLRQAWLFGNWDVTAGGALDDLFKTAVHVIPRFPIPENWYIDRAFDWGSSHPFAVGWYAEANGEEVRLPDGSIFAPVRGSLIKINEWYGSKEVGSNKGLKLSAPDIARGIIKAEIAMLEQGWIKKQPMPGPADNQICDIREGDVDSIEKKMADLGVRWRKSDKSKGSRINGLELMRNRLQSAVTGEGAGLYFMVSCRATIQILPTLPRDEKIPDDVDTDAEDHLYDETRYRVLQGNNRLAKTINVTFAR